MEQSGRSSSGTPGVTPLSNPGRRSSRASRSQASAIPYDFAELAEEGELLDEPEISGDAVTSDDDDPASGDEDFDPEGDEDDPASHLGSKPGSKGARGGIPVLHPALHRLQQHSSPTGTPGQPHDSPATGRPSTSSWLEGLRSSGSQATPEPPDSAGPATGGPQPRRRSPGAAEGHPSTSETTGAVATNSAGWGRSVSVSGLGGAPGHGATQGEGQGGAASTAAAVSSLLASSAVSGRSGATGGGRGMSPGPAAATGVGGGAAVASGRQLVWKLAVAAGVVGEGEGEGDRTAYEQWVLSRAKALNKVKSRAHASAAHEPKRTKSHWDHVLEEMEWLAKDFIRERKEKLATAKKVANAVCKSNMSIEARQVVREKAAAEEVRKRAKAISQQVFQFWTKARRVVATKVAVAVEAKKKVVMDKQLDLIVGQTERFSKMLASNLGPKATPAPALPAPPTPAPQALASPAKVAGNAVEKASKSVTFKQEAPPAGKGEIAASGHGASLKRARGDTGPAANGGAVVKEEKTEEAGYGERANKAKASVKKMESEGDDASPPVKRRATSARRAAAAAKSETKSKVVKKVTKKVVKSEENDEEFEADADDSSDDEETLAAQEEAELAELGGKAGAVDAAKQELAELDEEAELSLEQLMAKYGYAVPGAGDIVAEDHDEDGEAAAAGEEEEEEGEVKDDVGEQAEAAAEHDEPGSPGLDVLGSEEEGEVPPPVVKAAAACQEAQQQQQPLATGEEEGEAEETMEGVSQAAIAAQPTGHTLATTAVKTKVPFFLKATLREYQHIGLDWLVTMYRKRLNGILADEMGLGKTIQTISMLAHLACEEGSWGPHLVVVPTSVMLNWEIEFKKWCPAFKLLTYYGSAKERKMKRQGWSKANAFHVCITSYTLVLQDAKMFRRKKWKYLILDEAHMIKNWKSMRWQTLLNFNSKRRLLITGTPLQNDLMELWSLMHFLMPDIFSSHSQFKDWFCNPLTGMVEGSEAYNKQLVERLHGVLRPFLLRRMKSEVEKQMPAKHEHVVHCRLSKRQRQLYEEYMAASDVQTTLASGNFLGVINVLMQLRKVCNHPDLFEGRPIVSAYDNPPLDLQLPSCVLQHCVAPDLDLELHSLMGQGLGLGLGGSSSPLLTRAPGLLLAHGSALAANSSWEAAEVERLQVTYPAMLTACGATTLPPTPPHPNGPPASLMFGPTPYPLACPPGLGLPGPWPPQLAQPPDHASGRLAWAAPALPQDASALRRAAAAARLALVGSEEMAPLPPPPTGAGPLLPVGPVSGCAGPGPATARLQQMAGSLVASSRGWAILASALALQHARTAAWRTTRLAATAAINATRCNAGGPLFGSDLVQLCSGLAHPCSRALNVSRLRVTDHAWVGPSAATFAFVHGALAGPLPTGMRVPTAAISNGPSAGAVATDHAPESYNPRGLHTCLVRAHLPSLVNELSCTYAERAEAMGDLLREFMFAIPRARSTRAVVWCSHPDTSIVRKAAADAAVAAQAWYRGNAPLHTAVIRRTLFFPDRRLLQFDCGKLQELDLLLRRLKVGGHRCLIFTQMAKMLDLLESFLNLHGHTYMRLDGSTKPEQRQILMQKFNTDPRNFCFILSTRSGGVGINLTGADTVIFYDSDWNPAMDQQAQDRCHRIGQTREVHIYRLVSENTIEENILRKSDQKRQLDWMAIQSGGFNTEFLQKLSINDLFAASQKAAVNTGGAGAPSAADLKAALKSAEDVDDAAAAAQAEQEIEQEMDEFTKDPPPMVAGKGEEDKEDEEEGDEEGAGGKEGKEGKEKDKDKEKGTPTPPAPQGGATALALVDAMMDDGESTAEPGVMADVAAQVAGGAKAQDVLARLDASLKPIEKYAVRLVEELEPVDVNATAAAAIADINDSEWDAEEMAARKEEAEAAADEDPEDCLAEDWDREAATAAYRAMAEKAQRKREAAEAAAAAAEAAALAAAEAAAAQGWDADGGVSGGMGPGSGGLEPGSWMLPGIMLQPQFGMGLGVGAGGRAGAGTGAGAGAGAGAGRRSTGSLAATGGTTGWMPGTLPKQQQQQQPPMLLDPSLGLGLGAGFGMGRAPAAGLGGGSGGAPWSPPSAGNGTRGHASHFDLPAAAARRPWSAGWDAALCCAVQRVLENQQQALAGMGQQQGALPSQQQQRPVALGLVAWQEVGRLVRGVVEGGDLVAAEVITPERCKARYSQLLAASAAPLPRPGMPPLPGYSAPLPSAPATLPSPAPQPSAPPLLLLVPGLEERLSALFSSMGVMHRMVLEAGLGMRGLPGQPPPPYPDTPEGRARQQLASLAGELLPPVTSNGTTPAGRNPQRQAAVAACRAFADSALLGSTDAAALAQRVQAALGAA